MLGLSVNALLLTGCASIVNGESQPVSVTTPPTMGATCTLANDKGKWYINNTPGSTMVHRSYNDLIVACEKQGFQPNTRHIKSTTKPMALGNVFFGGFIGAGIDAADGAAYDYPPNIEIPMQKHHQK